MAEIVEYVERLHSCISHLQHPSTHVRSSTYSSHTGIKANPPVYRVIQTFTRFLYAVADLSAVIYLRTDSFGPDTVDKH